MSDGIFPAGTSAKTHPLRRRLFPTVLALQQYTRNSEPSSDVGSERGRGRVTDLPAAFYVAELEPHNGQAILERWSGGRIGRARLPALENREAKLDPARSPAGIRTPSAHLDKVAGERRRLRKLTTELPGCREAFFVIAVRQAGKNAPCNS